jgi:hypothetical protein
MSNHTGTSIEISTEAMDTLQHPQRTDTSHKQRRRAISFPIDTSPKQKAKGMGAPYRTPSPIRQAFYEASGKPKHCSINLCVADGDFTEHEITPRLKFDLALSAALTTPQSSPYLSPTDPLTPHGFTRQSTNSFGLLTPSTPSFSNLDTPLPSFTRHAVDGITKGHGTAQLLSMNENEANETNNGTSLESTVSSQVPQQQQSIFDIPLVQEHHELHDSVDNDQYVEIDEPVHTHFDEMQQHIRDAEIAAQVALDCDSSGKRRSTRLARKDIAKGM